MSQTVVEVQDVSKKYQLYASPRMRLKEALSLGKKKYHEDHYALDHLSFSVNKGECVGIIGENGSGKSTILKILTGVLTPTSGLVRVEGKVSALLELGAGFNPEYTGLENIYLNGSIMGFSREEMSRKVDQIIEFANIGDFIYQTVKTYSSGMFVRLAFAVAINVEPDILIVDEALSVGDVFFQLKCFNKFNEFRAAGKTILFVTHDTNTVIQYCDRVILLSNGQKIAEGEPGYIVDLYKKSMTREETSIEESAAKLPEDIEEKMWKQSFLTNEDVFEYGNKKAEIVDFAVFNHQGEATTLLEKGKLCTFYMKVLFHVKVNDPIFAYAIKDKMGLEITGSNTMLEEVIIERAGKGNVFEISFLQKMNLQGGPYYLSFGCTGFNGNGDLEIFHRLYDLLYLELNAKKVSTGFYDMNSKIEIKQKTI